MKFMIEVNGCGGTKCWISLDSIEEIKQGETECTVRTNSGAYFYQGTIEDLAAKTRCHSSVGGEMRLVR